MATRIRRIGRDGVSRSHSVWLGFPQGRAFLSVIIHSFVGFLSSMLGVQLMEARWKLDQTMWGRLLES
jgi:hypothetical protein